MIQIMYIGPDIRGVVRKNQIFTYQPEEVINQASAIDGLAKHLFVPMDDIVGKKNELRRQGSFLNVAYRQLEKKTMRR